MSSTSDAVKLRDYHRTTECNICGKEMRDDNLRRHMNIHADLNEMDAIGQREELIKRKEAHEHRKEQQHVTRKIALEVGAPPECYERSVRTTTASSMTTRLTEEELRSELLKDNQLYIDKVELGRNIDAIVGEGFVREESLTKDRKLALDLFRKQRQIVDVGAVDLRPWQLDLLEKLKQPSDREIIWVCGSRGNEGKTWFQSYVESWYGYERVVRLDMKNRQQDILHALSKRPLSSTDIFLFNVPRAEEESNLESYAAIEAIKDGYATTSKYDSTTIRFKTPNIVVIFANQLPDFMQLSRDRWACFRITDTNELTPIDVEEALLAQQVKKDQRNAPKCSRCFYETTDHRGKVHRERVDARKNNKAL